MERPSPTIKRVASGNEPLEGDPYALHSHGGGVGLTESSGGPAAPAVNTNRLPLMSSSTTTTSNGVSRVSATTSPSATTTISRSTKVNDDRPSYRLVDGIEEIQNVERIQRKEMISSATTVPSRINISIDDAIERLGQGPFQRRILIAAGCCFMADSMEVLLLSFLTVILQAEWDLTEAQSNSIMSVIFLGALTGTLILGPLGDRIGRKPVFVVTAAIICLAGLLTAASHTYLHLLLTRAIVGVGVGGLVVPFDTLAEFVPNSHRGTKLLAIEYFWTAGTLLVPVAAYVTLRNQGPNDWRYFVVLCASPCLISIVLGMLFVPESPRWLLARGRHDEALQILREAALRNGKQPQLVFPDGITIVDEDEEGDSTICDLLSPNWRSTTLLLWVTWAGFSFLYYGTILAVTLVFATEQGDQDHGSNRAYEFDYGAIFAAASSELAGTTLVIFLIDGIGRVPSQACSYLFGGISTFWLCVLANRNHPDRSHLIAAAFLARMFMMSGSCTTWVSTAEILTTEIRATGHSTANAAARIAGAICPFVVSSESSFLVIGIVVLVTSLITAMTSWHLPETKGRRMGSTTENYHRRHPSTLEPQQQQHSANEESSLVEMGGATTPTSRGEII